MPDNLEIKKRSQRTLLLLLAAFLIPVLGAYLMYLNVQDSGPGSTKNYGTLVRPARPVTPFELQTVNGKRFANQELAGKWSLVYIGQGACNEPCRTNLAKMQQGRLAQGKEMARIQLLYVVADKPDAMDALGEQYQPLLVVTGQQAVVNDFTGVFQISSDEQVLQMQRVYLVDPLGNLMMRYENGFELSGLIKDLELLLKTSQIG